MEYWSYSSWLEEAARPQNWRPVQAPAAEVEEQQKQQQQRQRRQQTEEQKGLGPVVELELRQRGRQTQL